MAEVQGTGIPDFIYKGSLAFLDVSGMSVTVQPCIYSIGEYIVYDGTTYSSTTDEGILQFIMDEMYQNYGESGYQIELGSSKVVTPPVSVPTWIGIYPNQA